MEKERNLEFAVEQSGDSLKDESARIPELSTLLTQAESLEASGNFSEAASLCVQYRSSYDVLTDRAIENYRREGEKCRTLARVSSKSILGKEIFPKKHIVKFGDYIVILRCPCIVSNKGKSTPW